MAGTAVFQLALDAPGLYKAIGSYSGCVQTSDPRGQAIVSAVVGSRLGNVANIAWNDLPLDYLDTWTARMNAVTTEDIRSAFERKLLHWQ